MFLELIYIGLCNVLSFALHIENSSIFPKPLSAKREKECFKEFKEGSILAKNELIEHNLRLVAHIVKKYYSSGCEQEDLISIGTIGLIKGISSFDYDKGTKFATYASRCIENEILMYFRNVKKSAFDIYISDTTENDKENGGFTIIDISSDEVSIIDNIDLKMKSQKLYEHISNKLSPREREIIVYRYGLNGKYPLTQREISKKMNISRSYVSRIEKKALEKLRVGFKT